MAWCRPWCRPGCLQPEKSFIPLAKRTAALMAVLRIVPPNELGTRVPCRLWWHVSLVATMQRHLARYQGDIVMYWTMVQAVELT